MAQQPSSRLDAQLSVVGPGTVATVEPPSQSNGTLVEVEGSGRLSTRHHKSRRGHRSSTAVEQVAVAPAPMMNAIYLNNVNTVPASAAAAPERNPKAAYVYGACSVCSRPCLDSDEEPIVCECGRTALHPWCADTIQRKGRTPGCPYCHDVMELEDRRLPLRQWGCPKVEVCGFRPLVTLWWFIKTQLLAGLFFVVGGWLPLGFFGKVVKFLWPSYDDSGAFIQLNISATPQPNATLFTFNFFDDQALKLVNFYLGPERAWPMRHIGFWPWGNGWHGWYSHFNFGITMLGYGMATYFLVVPAVSLLGCCCRPLWRSMTGKTRVRRVRR